MARYEPRRSDTSGRKRPSVVTFSHAGKREASRILRKTRIRPLSRRLKQHYKFRQPNNHFLYKKARNGVHPHERLQEEAGPVHGIERVELVGRSHEEGPIVGLAPQAQLLISLLWAASMS